MKSIVISISPVDQVERKRLISEIETRERGGYVVRPEQGKLGLMGATYILVPTGSRPNSNIYFTGNTINADSASVADVQAAIDSS